ncbi:hypothetical protein Hamer_G026565 [Homarus americanus]|uniref:Uncharacterized protein n=1 Tax=Homarus americanus TaxID=6706 RepID=A0A8J5N8W0_HOMAM|nr:hypothetical protein Hamer_G026565 [Homarus americanus]
MQMVIVLVVITVVFVLSWSPIDLRLFINQIRPQPTTTKIWSPSVSPPSTRSSTRIHDEGVAVGASVAAGNASHWSRVVHKPDYLPQEADQSCTPQGPLQEATVQDERRKKTASQHHHNTTSPLPKDTTTTLTKEMMEGKELVEIFKDSGTGSNNNTPSTHCSDSGTAAAATPYSHNCDPACHGIVFLPVLIVSVPPPAGIVFLPVLIVSVPPPAGAGERTLGSLNVVPIPVFTSSSIEWRRWGSHATTHACPHASRGSPRPPPPAMPQPPGRPHTPSTQTVSQTTPHLRFTHTGRGRLVARVTYGRRHSWCCTQDGLEAKHYRTQSTQTFTHYQEEPRVSCCYYHHHHHHHHQRRQRDDYTSHVRHDHDQNLRNHSQRHPGDDHALYHHNDLSPSYHGLLTPDYPHHGQQQHLDVYNNEQDDSVFIMANDFTPLNHDTDLTPDKKTNSVFSFMPTHDHPPTYTYLSSQPPDHPPTYICLSSQPPDHPPTYICLSPQPPDHPPTYTCLSSQPPDHPPTYTYLSSQPPTTAHVHLSIITATHDHPPTYTYLSSQPPTTTHVHLSIITATTTTRPRTPVYHRHPRPTAHVHLSTLL